VPLIAVLLSTAGLIPFIVCGLLALGHSPDTANRMLVALIDYAALILAFSGGMYWVLSLLPTSATGPATSLNDNVRLGFGAVPLLIAWAAMLATSWFGTWIALLLLIFGYILTIVMERQSGQHTALPRQWVWLRWGFTAVAVAMLTTVLTLRLLGQTLVL